MIQETAAAPLANGLIPLTGGNFRLGVIADGFYARAQFITVGNGIAKYGVAVPKNRSLRLVADTSLQLSQLNSGAIVTAQPSLLIVVNGQAELDVDLQVQ